MNPPGPGSIAIVLQIGQGPGSWHWATTAQLHGPHRTPRAAEAEAERAGYTTRRPKTAARAEKEAGQLRRKHPAGETGRCSNRWCAPCQLAAPLR